MNSNNKNNILFICSNMGVGGFQKSLVSLLSCFDYKKYDVDLLLFDPSGIYMNLIPNEVHIVHTNVEPEYFYNCGSAVKCLIKRRKIIKALFRMFTGIIGIFDKGFGALLMMSIVPPIKKEYDAAIDYNGQHILYYLVNKIKSKRKISYFHNDYKKWDYYEKMDRKAYKEVDAIVTVSDECVRSMKTIFPEYADKVFCIENIVSDKTVNLYPVHSNVFKDNFDGIRLLTVGRVCKDKGFDYACEALNYLIDNSYKIKWYFVGPVTEKDFCNNVLKKYDVKGHIELLGVTDNPYDYMREADIIVQPSRIEGKSVAIEEAKILNKPIVVTNFSTVKNQILDGRTGEVVGMSGKELFEGIKKMIDNPQIMLDIVNNQKRLCRGNESEVNKVYCLIENNCFDD